MQISSGQTTGHTRSGSSRKLRRSSLLPLQTIREDLRDPEAISKNLGHPPAATTHGRYGNNHRILKKHWHCPGMGGFSDGIPYDFNAKPNMFLFWSESNAYALLNASLNRC
uniref:Sulfatase domain-containing protein n=1 Tax=Steinernema glaseri TaxID=37863 RepID=A0A1I8A0U3_9BILA